MYCVCSRTNVQTFSHLGTTTAKKAIVALMGTAARRHQTIKDDRFNPFIITAGLISPAITSMMMRIQLPVQVRVRSVMQFFLPYVLPQIVTSQFRPH